MEEVSWCKLSKKSKKQDSDLFLKVKPGSNLKVRLVGRLAKVYKIFTDNKYCLSLDSEETGQKLKEKYSDKLGNVNIRYASWCIDRDDNSMKILDMPYSVAKVFGNSVKLVGKQISGKHEGVDWKIYTNGKKGKDVRYQVVCLGDSSLTDDEIKMVDEKKSEQDGYYDLRKIFKSYSFKEAEEKILSSE
jgi:hypothetical protein